MPSTRRADRLTELANFIGKLEHLLLKVAILIVFIVWLWNHVSGEISPKMPPLFPGIRPVERSIPNNVHFLKVDR